MKDYLKLKKSYEAIEKKNQSVKADEKALVLQPQIGDVFYMSGHIGIVAGINEKSISTVEGNTDGEGSFTGNGAYAKTRELRKVLGYARPDYLGLQKYLIELYKKEQSKASQGTAAGSQQATSSNSEAGVN